MATLTVEDGSVVENANSYASIATCNAYHTALGNTAWTGTDAAKEAAILRAMAYLEALTWRGRKYTYEQPLEWPRANVVLGGYLIETDEVPQKVINALCESALVEIEEANALRPALDRGGQVTSFTLTGVLSETYASGAPAGKTYPAIIGMLRGLTYGSSNIKVELA
jgi:hypothetical protein